MAALKREVSSNTALDPCSSSIDGPRRLCRHVHCNSQEYLFDRTEYSSRRWSRDHSIVNACGNLYRTLSPIGIRKVNKAVRAAA